MDEKIFFYFFCFLLVFHPEILYLYSLYTYLCKCEHLRPPSLVVAFSGQHKPLIHFSYQHSKCCMGRILTIFWQKLLKKTLKSAMIGQRPEWRKFSTKVIHSLQGGIALRAVFFRPFFSQ